MGGVVDHCVYGVYESDAEKGAAASAHAGGAYGRKRSVDA